ncbi:response regulator transcription factor [bacterium]|nr:response regulator transcription factor [bacterium]
MRILLVEDKLPLNKSLAKILRRHAYAVDQAFDGEQALCLVDDSYYDVMILDLTLPKIDGLQVLALVRERGLKLPILVLTARVTTPEIVTGLRSGADDYLAKPFEVEELLARLQALLRRVSDKKQPVLQVADLILDPSSGQVTRAGQVIQLSRKEYQLLAYLMHKSHWIITKQELLAHVWENETQVYDRVVDTYICFLRKKIDKAFPHLPTLIQTVKTRGYRLGLEAEHV